MRHLGRECLQPREMSSYKGENGFLHPYIPLPQESRCKNQDWILTFLHLHAQGCKNARTLSNILHPLAQVCNNVVIQSYIIYLTSLILHTWAQGCMSVRIASYILDFAPPISAMHQYRSLMCRPTGSGRVDPSFLFKCPFAPCFFLFCVFFFSSKPPHPRGIFTVPPLPHCCFTLFCFVVLRGWGPNFASAPWSKLGPEFHQRAQITPAPIMAW